MSKIHGMMDTGKRSMMNSQTALQTVGHNIANKSTEGFSRQRVELQSAEPTGVGKIRVGNGAKTAMVTRVNNPYLEKQIGKEQSVLGFEQGKMDALGRVEQVYNEQMNKGLNSYVSEFFNSMREFSNNPESLATRTQVKETANFLTKDFKRVNTQLGEISKDIDQQLQTHMHEINEMSREIAQLNEKVQIVENQGGPANDERDRRDLLIKQLGQKINIRWAEGSDGTVTITAGNSALLVSGYDSKKLDVMPTPGSESKKDGTFDVVYRSSDRSEPYVVTSQLTGGAVGGLLEVRDKTIHGLYQSLDEMAYTLAKTVNEVHGQGFDSYNRKAGEFFEEPVSMKDASAHLAVSQEVLDDPARIAAGLTPGAPGDNRIANKIAELQNQGVVGESGVTIDEFYNSMVGKVGIESKRSQSVEAAQKDVVKQLQNIRESISGVSLDEETTKLIEFQKSFDASARLIKTADEMFDTVLNLKKL